MVGAGAGTLGAAEEAPPDVAKGMVGAGAGVGLALLPAGSGVVGVSGFVLVAKGIVGAGGALGVAETEGFGGWALGTGGLETGAATAGFASCVGAGAFR